MAYDPDLDPGTRKLGEWIVQVQKAELHKQGFGWDRAKGDQLRVYLKDGIREGFLAAVGPPSDYDLKKLRWRFQLVRAWLLLLMIVVGAVVASALENRSLPSLVVAALSGLAGSATAALISCLDRRAAGFEAPDGTASPASSEKKERFSFGMAEWLVTRPALGLIMGGAIYVGIEGKALGVKSDSLHATVFWALLGGLFAKTLY